jgi:hypothetical protein
MSDEAEHKHEKVVVSVPQEDGTTKRTIESYYDRLAQRKVEIEKTVPTSKRTILKDIIDCLELITRDGSPELIIHIKAKHGEPTQLTKQWTQSKESFGRR